MENRGTPKIDLGHQILLKKKPLSDHFGLPQFYRRSIWSRSVFHITWVSQFCSVVGLDDIDGAHAGSDFIGLVMYVLVKGCNFIGCHPMPIYRGGPVQDWNPQVGGVNW